MLRFRSLILAMLVVAAAPPALVRAAGSPEPFRDGDRVAVIGDSITQSRRTHSYIWNYYVTRFPDRRVFFGNCGISGDSASGAVRRFDWDIAIHKPTVATIMLGMNDVGRGHYGKDKTSEADRKRQQDALDRYGENMIALSEKLKAIGARIVYITPSIYDQTGTQKREDNYGVNDALGKCGEIVRELADKFGGTVVDLHGPMTRINAEGQAKNPDFSIIGPDRIHPGDIGQFIMAALFLEQQGLPALVSKTVVDAASGKAVSVERAALSNLKATPQGVEFDLIEESLPYYVPPSTRPALDLVAFQEKLNQEVLQVTGLEDGDYEIAVDGQPVLRASSSELAQGVNLADAKASPMMRQAHQVWRELERRQNLVGHRLRRFAELRHHDLRQTDLDIDDYEGVVAYLEKKQADLEAKNHSMAGYQRGKLNAYKTNKPKEAEIAAQADAALEKAYELAKPVSHKFAVRPATASQAAEEALDGVSVDDFAFYEGWTPINWSEVEPKVTVAEGVAKFHVPRTDNHRDMVGVSRSFDLDMAGGDSVNVRLRATKGAHLGIEVRTDSGSKRIASYVQASGEWQTLSFPIEGKYLKSMSLLLNEPGKVDHQAPDGMAIYEIDRIWITGGAPQTAPASAEGAHTVDDFDAYEGYAKAGWTNTQEEYKETGKTVVLTLPRTPGQRDMFGLSRTMALDLAPYKELKIRLKADKDAPIGMELVIDGKLTRIASYVRASGDWQTMAFPIEGGRMSAYTIILAESDANEKNESKTVTYELDRIWVE